MRNMGFSFAAFAVVSEGTAPTASRRERVNPASGRRPRRTADLLGGGLGLRRSRLDATMEMPSEPPLHASRTAVCRDETWFGRGLGRPPLFEVGCEARRYRRGRTPRVPLG